MDIKEDDTLQDMREQLYSDRKIVRKKVNESLALLDIERAIQLLSLLLEDMKPPPPKELTSEIEAMQALQAKLSTIAKDDILSLVALYREFDGGGYLDTPLPRNILMEGLAREITTRIGDNSWKFITEKLHPAEFYFYLKDYDNLKKVCEEYIQKDGEHAFIRQLMAVYYFKDGNYKEANNRMALSLVINPFILKGKYFVDDKIGDWVEEIKKAHADFYGEFLHDFVRMWSKSVIPLIPNEDVATYLVERLQVILPIREERDWVINFLNNFYLAEYYRKKNVSIEIISTYRKQLKKHFPEIYSYYLECIR